MATILARAPYESSTNVLTRISTGAWITLGLIVAAVVLRLPHFGDPAFDIDEEFYLLVGDRMLHGAIPYVYIWDRKPIGLFLLYAGMRLLGDGVLPYQIIAALFAGGTAAVIAAIVRRPAGWLGSAGAGLAYLLWLETIDGGGGQSPVFYNLLVAAAGWATLRAIETADSRRFRTLAFAAMALAGLAIQIKYTALFEGAYFGLLLAWTSRRHSPGILQPAAWTTALAATALAPTTAAVLGYAALGQLDAFWFANFVSIFRRAPTPSGEIHYRLGVIAMHVLPFAVCAVAGAWELGRRTEPESRWRLFVGGWIVAALAGFFSIGALYVHYALPLFVPFAIAAAPIFRKAPVGTVLMGAMLWMPAGNLGYPDFATTARSQRQIAALAALIPPQVKTGCMQMFAGPPALYRISGACFVSRFVFPDHLVGPRDAGAIGLDQTAEVERIFRANPLVIVSDDAPHDPVSKPSYAMMRRLRDANYDRTGSVTIRGSTYDVWLRRQRV